MRVLFLTSSYPYGHGENFIENELRFLSQHVNLDVLPIYPRGSVKDSKVSISGNYLFLELFRFKYLFCYIGLMVKKPKLFYSIHQLCLDRTLSKGLRNFALLPKLSYFFQNNKSEYDFVYAHWLSAPAQFAMLFNEATKVPFGVTAHRWDIFDNNNLVNKITRSSFVRVISNKSKESVNSLINDDDLASKIEVLFLGVQVQNSAFKRLAKDSIATCLCVASLIPVKGHEYLFRSLSLLNKRGVKVNLLLVGDGELKTELARLASELNISEQVKFQGNLSHSNVQKLMQSKEITFSCLPSVDLGNGLHEGIPVSLMEAMSYGIPCVSTDTGSISELIVDGVSGLLIPDKNPLELSLAIEKLISSPELYESISKNSIFRIREQFDQGKLNDLILNLIQKNYEK